MMEKVSREEVEKYLFKLLTEEKKIDVRGLTFDSTLKDLNIDSFSFLEVVFSIEDHFKITFPKNFDNIETLKDIVNLTHNLVLEKTASA